MSLQTKTEEKAKDNSDNGNVAIHTTPAASIIKEVMNTNHTYTDYAGYSHLDHPSSSRSKRKSFPTKLHEILSDATYADIIAWSSHGRSFRVLNKTRLLEVTGQEHFRFKKIDSFYRMLNLWGFRRLHRPGPDHLAYYHEKFLQGLPHLAALMKSREAKYMNTPPSILYEPDFYKMAIDHPLPCKMTVDAPENTSGSDVSGVQEKEVGHEVEVDPKDEVRLVVQEEKVSQCVEVDPKDDVGATTNQQAPMFPHANPPMGFLPTAHFGRVAPSPFHGIYRQYFPQQAVLSQRQHGGVLVYYPDPIVIGLPQRFIRKGNPFRFV